MMRFKKLCFLLAGIGFAFSSFPQNAQPVNLQCEYLKNPIGLDASAPRLMWQMDDNRNGAFQSAYQVIVGTDSAKVILGDGNCWNSGKTNGAIWMQKY